MAKKKNKQIIRPWCWYCEREFEDEKVLMQHQKAKHFKCNMCPRRLNTAGGLAVHIQQVHKLEPDNLPRIENAIPGRDGYEIEIFGMEGIPAPDVADYKRRKEIELGLAAGSISQPQAKRPRVENRPLSEQELKAALEAHKALMGASQSEPTPAPADGGGAMYSAPAQTYAAPPLGMLPPGMPPGIPPPGFFPPGAMPGQPPFPPFGMPPGFPPPGFSPPPGMPFPPPPGMMPMMPPGGFPPGMPPMPPPGIMRPPMPAPSFVPASQGAAPATPTPSVPQPPPSSAQTARPTSLSLPNPALKQTNPPFKKPTELKYTDANFSPEEIRAYHPKYQYKSSGESAVEETRGTKRARAEDFL